MEAVASAGFETDDGFEAGGGSGAGGAGFGGFDCTGIATDLPGFVGSDGEFGSAAAAEEPDEAADGEEAADEDPGEAPDESPGEDAGGEGRLV